MSARGCEHSLLALTMLPEPTPGSFQSIREAVRREPDWDYVFQAAERLGTLPLLASALARADTTLPSAVGRRCRQVRVQSALRAAVAEKTLQEISAAFESEAIPLLVLKGLPLAHELYGETALRPGLDLDLLVVRPDRDRAIGLTKRLGYRLPPGSLSERFYARHHFHVLLEKQGREAFPVELHWDTQPYFSTSKVPQETLWTSARIVRLGSLAVRVPGRKENFLYLLQHLSRHAMGLARLCGADPISCLLDPMGRARLVWLADLTLLARTLTEAEWLRVRELAPMWGLEQELHRLQNLVGRLENLRPAEAAPEGTGRIPSVLSRFARTSKTLHLRPILAVEGIRCAFPGATWVRNRYALRDTSAWSVTLRMLRHALEVLWRLAHLCAAALSEFLLTVLNRRRFHASKKVRIIQSEGVFPPCQERISTDIKGANVSI